MFSVFFIIISIISSLVVVVIIVVGKLQDKIPCSEIRKRTKIIDIIEYTLKQKWKWAGHIARMKDNRWTKRCTEWQPRRGRDRPSRRWQDDITEKEGTTDKVCLLVGCLKSQQHASVSQGRICTDNFYVLPH